MRPTAPDLVAARQTGAGYPGEARRKPAPGGPPTGPLPLGPLPPRVLPSPAVDPSPAERPAPGPARPAAARVGPAPSGHDLTAVVASGGVAHRREVLQERLDLDDAEFEELLADGWLVELAVGRRLRYCFTATVDPQRDPVGERMAS